MLAVPTLLLAILGPFLLLLSRAYYTSLRRIPAAHWSSRFLPLWILLIRYRRRENRTLLQVHKRLGPTVLLSPTEISVNDLSGLRAVYTAGWDKPAWYTIFFNYNGTPTMFTMLDGKAHGHRKRMVSHVYAKSSLLSNSGMDAVRRDVLGEKFLPWLRDVARTGQVVGAYNALGRMALDSVTMFVFGGGNGTGYIRDNPAWEKFKWTYEARGRWAFYTQELPLLERWLGVGAIMSRSARAWVDAWCMDMCKRAARSEEDDAFALGEAEVWRALRKGIGKEHGDPEVEIRFVASELLDQLLAGHETTAIALTYALYHLSTHPTIAGALRKELLSLDSSINNTPQTNIPQINTRLPSLKSLDTLPLLSAIISETLRLNAPIPGPQPRTTGPDAVLNGVGPLPKGLRVSANAWCLHRNEQVFPSSEEWEPERWLQSDKSTADDERRLRIMNRWFWAFGSGGRMCIGSNFALLQMKTVLAAIYTNFRTEVVDASGIEQEDGYTVGPRKDLMLRFVPL